VNGVRNNVANFRLKRQRAQFIPLKPGRSDGRNCAYGLSETNDYFGLWGLRM